jgi:predicted CopG family antitoxin
MLDDHTQTMHSACMATKTISLKTEAYQRLRSVRRYPDESFSDIVLRATWPEETVTAGELLERLRSTPPVLTQEALDRVDAVSRSDAPPEEKWTTR